jgi:Ca-activated chloride channel family protein
MGNYKDSKIQTLAKRGHGNFAYLDNFKEAEKVLLQEFTQTLYSVADDVYMNVEFNPKYVKGYRLLGYDNKLGALTDSLSVLEGGEIGSGQSLISIFEIAPEKQNPGVISDGAAATFAEIKMKYKLPNKQPKDTTNHIFTQLSRMDLQPFDQIDKCYRFSAAVAMFGAMLRSSSYIKNTSWNDIISLAASSVNEKDVVQKEFINIVQQAKVLYSKEKKRKKPKAD